MNCKTLLLLSLITLTALSAEARLTLPSIIADNMVVQQNGSARLWGWSTACATIHIAAEWGKTVRAKADSHGRWTAMLPTPVADTREHTISIRELRGLATTDSLTLGGVLIGEVWLASGQSNMEMPLRGFSGCNVKDGALTAMHAATEAPLVRMFTVPKRQSWQEQEHCGGHWARPTFNEALDFSAVAWHFASSLSGALGIPVGVVNSSYGGAHVESWESREVCAGYPDIPKDSAAVYQFGRWDFDRPMLMYNAMFCPVSRYTVRGVIWYQGCSNIGGHRVYPQRLSDMVRLWRQSLGAVPFYQVQVAPYIYGDTAEGTGGALLREAQDRAAAMIPNSGIVCINDLARPEEAHNIHPSDKRGVGLRLALMALCRDYGLKDVSYEGPRYDPATLRIVGDTAIVGFKTDRFGICRNNGLVGFEIAGADRHFHAARAEFRWQTNTVALTAEGVTRPVAVRYCFRDFLIGNVIGGNELPLFPFRTDDWEE